MYRRLFAIVLMSLAPALASGATTGKVAGVVTERETGNPLPGANVVLEGTVLGATADETGRFFMLNVPAGTYTVTCSFIGYQEFVLKNVQVLPDLTTPLEFQLNSRTLEMGEMLEVVADRPLVQKDQTGSMRLVTGDEIEYMPVRGYEQVTALQAGVVNLDGNLYIRGGRLGEVAYYVDGFSQQDLQTGLSSTAINNNAIDQVVVTVGGFDAEYGRVMSGIVNVVTREGRSNYTGSVEYITDEIVSRDWLDTPSFGYNNLDFALGGPVVPNTNRTTFFVSGERRDQEDSKPRWGVDAYSFERDWLSAGDFEKLSRGMLPHQALEGWTWQGKMTFQITDNLKLKAGFLGSRDEYETYSHPYRYNLRHSPIGEDFNNSAFATLNYVINPRTFFTLGANVFTTLSKYGDGVHFENVFDYGRPGGNPRFDPESLFYVADVASTPIGRDEQGFITGDEGHIFNEYRQRSSFYVTPVDFDLTSQVTQHHLIKAGFDIQWHRLRHFRHLTPSLVYQGPFNSPQDPGGFRDVDRYGYAYRFDQKRLEEVDSGRDRQKNPILASFYVQDKMEFEGLVLNVGLRYDYLNARTEALRNEDVPLGGDSTLDPGDLLGNRAHHKLSPRVGLGFPVAEGTVFHANYGVFFQQPNLKDLYVGLDYLEYKAQVGGYYYAFGNPNLDPEKTTAYEVGVTRQVGGHASVDVTAYYKSVENLVQVTTVLSTPAAFSSYKNRDFGTIKGVDVSVQMRRVNRLSAWAAYSLSYAKGTGSNAETQRNIAFAFQPGFTEPPKITAPLDFDQRHKISAGLDYRFLDRDGPRVMGSRPLSNAGMSVLLTAGSGFPYTPTYVYNEVTVATVRSRPSGPLNSSFGPWSFQVDMKVNKEFQLGRVRGNVYAWAINLLNRRNVSARDKEDRGIQTMVYSSTGSALTTRWLNTPEGREFIQRYGEVGRQKYELKELDPRNFSTPRQVRFGMAYSF